MTAQVSSLTNQLVQAQEDLRSKSIVADQQFKELQKARHESVEQSARAGGLERDVAAHREALAQQGDQLRDALAALEAERAERRSAEQKGTLYRLQLTEAQAQVRRWGVRTDIAHRRVSSVSFLFFFDTR